MVERPSHSINKGQELAGSPSPNPPQEAGAHWEPLPRPSPRGGSLLEAPPIALPKGRELRLAVFF